MASRLVIDEFGGVSFVDDTPYVEPVAVVYTPPPAPIAYGSLAEVQASMSGGVYHHYSNGSNDWDVINGVLYVWSGSAPPDVRAAYRPATQAEIDYILKPDPTGGSDFSNILTGLAFIAGGAIATGGLDFGAITDSVSQAFSPAVAAPEAAVPIIGAEAEVVSIAGTVAPEAATLSEAATADIALGGVGGSAAAESLLPFFAPAVVVPVTAVASVVAEASQQSLTLSQAATADIALGGTGGTVAGEALLPFFEPAYVATAIAGGAAAAEVASTAGAVTTAATTAATALTGSTALDRLLTSLTGTTLGSLLQNEINKPLTPPIDPGQPPVITGGFTLPSGLPGLVLLGVGGILIFKLMGTHHHKLKVHK